MAACTLLTRYIRENFKIATFSRLSGIPRSEYNFIFFDLTLLKATAVKPARPRLDFDGLIL